MKTLIFFSMLCLVSGAQAGFDDTRTHIEQLLQQGKKVAILVIDMQVAYEGRGSLHKLSLVLGEQINIELDLQSALTKYPKLHVVSKAAEPCEK
ncbi:hypothetical protein [Endozoicomonas numazuensis]|uniref:Isochorismatase-like domain-containing protein n=1 Tax=Endozoicomonas numazuensis TaxID=1137799 RepID=A0A081NG79_9GAMM|nr:hypothetical protein [Endozoicomonas numazuensis]KEQ17452.1 hypothetical protein GZ78_16895 [Endozoicomonas numazuensis]